MKLKSKDQLIKKQTFKYWMVECIFMDRIKKKTTLIIKFNKQKRVCSSIWFLDYHCKLIRLKKQRAAQAAEWQILGGCSRVSLYFFNSFLRLLLYWKSGVTLYLIFFRSYPRERGSGSVHKAAVSERLKGIRSFFLKKKKPLVAPALRFVNLILQGSCPWDFFLLSSDFI